MPRVDYNGLVADVREEDLAEGMTLLSGASRQERRQILASVKRALDQATRAMEKGEAFSAQQLQDTTNDIGIWFAGETLAERTEPYKVMVQ